MLYLLIYWVIAGFAWWTLPSNGEETLPPFVDFILSLSLGGFLAPVRLFKKIIE